MADVRKGFAKGLVVSNVLAGGAMRALPDLAAERRGILCRYFRYAVMPRIVRMSLSMKSERSVETWLETRSSQYCELQGGLRDPIHSAGSIDRNE